MQLAHLPFNGFSFSNYLISSRIVLGWRSRSGLWWRPTRRGIASRRLIETMVWGAGFGRLPVKQKLPIGSVDLLMPENTHSRSGSSYVRLCGLLELLRRPIAQRRVQPAAVVVLLDELLDVRTQVFQLPVLVGVDLFPFKRLEKAFATGVVVRIRWPTHARDHLVLLQDLHVFAGSVLHPTIRVVHQARWRLALRDRFLQSRDRQPRRQRSAQLPTHNSA